MCGTGKAYGVCGKLGTRAILCAALVQYSYRQKRLSMPVDVRSRGVEAVEAVGGTGVRRGKDAHSRGARRRCMGGRRRRMHLGMP